MDFEVKTVIDNIDDMTDIIKNQLNDIAEGFVSVGYYLRKTDETMLYKQKGYKTIYEYAKDTFGIGRSTASRFMEINQKYSKDGYSPEIDLKWSGYGSSKLTEMLGLPEDVQEAIPVDATVRDIREAKGIIRETEHNYSDQMELCDIAQPDPAETNWLQEFAKHYFSKEDRDAFQKMTDWLRKDEPENDITTSILLIINPTKFKMIRLERANVMLTVDKIKVMPYRNQGEQQEYTYIDFGRAFETLFYPAGIDTPINEAYKNVYGESYYKEKHYPEGKNDANDTGNRESAPKDEAGTDRSVQGETRAEGASETTKEETELSDTESNVCDGEKSREAEHTENEPTAEESSGKGTTQTQKEAKETTEAPNSAAVSAEEETAEVKTEICHGDTDETQIPGQTELVKDFPEYCPPDMNAPEQQDQSEEVKPAYATRRLYLSSIDADTAAEYMGKAMEKAIRNMPGVSFGVLTKESFWKEFFETEVDRNGDEIECVN